MVQFNGSIIVADRCTARSHPFDIRSADHLTSFPPLGLAQRIKEFIALIDATAENPAADPLAGVQDGARIQPGCSTNNIVDAACPVCSRLAEQTAACSAHEGSGPACRHDARHNDEFQVVWLDTT